MSNKLNEFINYSAGFVNNHAFLKKKVNFIPPIILICPPKYSFAHVVKLVDTLSSGGSAFGRGGSNPLMRTFPNYLQKAIKFDGLFLFEHKLYPMLHLDS